MDVSDWRRMISDPGTSGEALLALATHPEVDPEALAALALDGVRLRENPAIASAIYHNPRVPLSVANTAVITCRREGIAPEGIPGFEELAAAIAADPTALDPVAQDPAFTELLAEGEDSSGLDEEPASEASPDADGGGAPAAVPGGEKTSAGGRRSSAPIDFTRLKLYEKVRMATLGNAHCRQNLLRDPNRMVALAAIRSPRITESEIAKAAGNRSLAEEIIRYIANRKELVKQYAVKLALVGNAKCPLAVALRLLPSLHAEDIKHLARSKNVPGALSVAARRLAAARAPQ
jgi:hypothetical protein